jgi:hypothetical protein
MAELMRVAMWRMSVDGVMARILCFSAFMSIFCRFLAKCPQWFFPALYPDVSWCQGNQNGQQGRSF